MSTTNPIWQVLVTKGNLAPLAAGNPITSLAPGQVGVFNYHTGLSLGTASAAADCQDFFLAVGLNRSGAGGGATLEDINKSAGQVIQAARVSSYGNRCYTAPASKIVDITDFTVKCNHEYLVKIEFRNQHIYSQYGYNQFTKTFQEVSGCCDDACTDCATGDCNTLALNFVNDINLDPDQLVKADLLDYTTTPGTPVVVPVSGFAAWVAANAGKCLGIRLTSITENIRKYCDINLQYYNPRGTQIIVSALDGFLCNSTVTTSQELTYEEGAGYDIKWLEYEAGGWNGKPGPYRVSALTGTARTGFEYWADDTVKYSLTTLSYDVRSQSNFLKYDGNTQTDIAIPCADTTTLTGLIAILDHILTQFSANAGNAALCDCTGANHTGGYAVANNGVKSLT
jgi:hypothetical protein